MPVNNFSVMSGCSSGFGPVLSREDKMSYSWTHEGAQWLSGRVLDLGPGFVGSSLTASLCCVLEQEHLS